MIGRASVILILFALLSCNNNSKYELVIYQSFYFKKGQEFKLEINDGEYSKSKFFNRTYQTEEYKRIKTFRTNKDSIRVYFKLDKKDTTFIMPSDYTTRLAVGSDAYGGILIGTDKDTHFWETQ